MCNAIGIVNYEGPNVQVKGCLLYTSICGVLTAISCKEAYMQESAAIFSVTAAAAALQLWNGFHLYGKAQENRG